MAAIKTISADDLKAKLERGDDFQLVMSLGEWAYEAKRIPGSIRFNTPADAAASMKPDAEVIVYCSDPACIGSQYAYQYLVDRGFSNVRRYAGGLAEWEERGFPLEGTMIDG